MSVLSKHIASLLAFDKFLFLDTYTTYDRRPRPSARSRRGLRMSLGAGGWGKRSGGEPRVAGPTTMWRNLG